MSILGNIFRKIFPSAHAANAPTAPQVEAPSGAAAAQAGLEAQKAAAPVAMSEVDVEKQLNDLAAKNSQKLNWETSIVDLMKLLDIDSSLTARKELAKELNYTGDTADSAAMNIWLHKQVMNQVAANGGKVPASLRD